MGKFSECLIYAYLVALSAFCVTYAVYVISWGGAYLPSVPVNVVLDSSVYMSNLTTHSSNSELLLTQLKALKNAGVKGVVVDVWWGLVELTPQTYTWDQYDELFSLIQQSNLTVKASLAFHQSDESDILLPSWLTQVEYEDDIYYQDRHGSEYLQYLSCGVDFRPIFPPTNRTAIGMYIDFMFYFAEHFSQYFDVLITEVQIGLGPDGELKYPSFSNGNWTFPGIGEFQCYDKNLKTEYFNFAAKAGHPEWGTFPNASALGTYNNVPGNTTFFTVDKKGESDNFQSEYGQFFLNWYSNRLVRHGQAILGNAVAIIGTFSQNVSVTAELGCVYWQYKDVSHAAELTAGYKNDNFTGYGPFLEMLDGLDVTFAFGCFEMSDKQQASTSAAAPEELVYQTLQNAQSYGTRYQAQNTFPANTSSSYGQIEHNLRRDTEPIVGFDYRGFSDAVEDTEFSKFVSDLSQPKRK